MQRSDGNLHSAADAAAVSITAMEYSIGRTVNGTVGIFAALAATYLSYPL